MLVGRSSNGFHVKLGTMGRIILDKTSPSWPEAFDLLARTENILWGWQQNVYRTERSCQDTLTEIFNQGIKQPDCIGPVAHALMVGETENQWVRIEVLGSSPSNLGWCYQPITPPKVALLEHLGNYILAGYRHLKDLKKVIEKTSEVVDQCLSGYTIDHHQPPYTLWDIRLNGRSYRYETTSHNLETSATRLFWPQWETEK